MNRYASGARSERVLAALIGGLTAYGLACIVPGSAVLTALTGNGDRWAGRPFRFIWSEIKLLVNLIGNPCEGCCINGLVPSRNLRKVHEIVRI